MFDRDYVSEVPPDAGHKAAFDPAVYKKALKSNGPVTGSLWSTWWLFLIGFLSGTTLAINLGFTGVPWIGVGCGLILVVAAALFRRAALAKKRAHAVALQARLHDLDQETTQLEADAARASGAFDRWEKK